MALPRIERRRNDWHVHTTCGVYVIPAHVPIRSIEYGFSSIIVRWGDEARYVEHGQHGRQRHDLYDLLVKHLLK